MRKCPFFICAGDHILVVYSLFIASYEVKGDEEKQIAHLAEDSDIYNKLSRSLAPEIFGYEHIE